MSFPGTVELEIGSLAAGGRGVGRVDGKVWFVEGALPGDRVRAESLASHPRHVDAVAVEIVRPSPDRRSPPCPLSGNCGGCPLMPLDEARQRELKVGLLREALARIGRLEVPAIEPPRTPTAPLEYRNRVEFAVRAGGGRASCVGLHGTGGRSLVDVERCLLQDETAHAVLRSVREFFAAAELRERPGFALRLGIRRGRSSGETLVTVRESGPRRFRDAAGLAGFLSRRHADVVGVVELRAAGRGRGGVRARVLAGRDWLAERAGDVAFELPATSFAQVSAEGTAELVRLVGQLALPVARLGAVDLYGGLGLYGVELARLGAAPVTVCDADEDAIAAGRALAARAGLERVRHVHADAAAFLGSASVGAPEVLVANPPRGGFSREAGRALCALAPPRLIVVSCDAATLARDLGTLVRDARYRIDRIVPVDLFPQTAHLEAVVRLTR